MCNKMDQVLQYITVPKMLSKDGVQDLQSEAHITKAFPQ